MFNIEEVLKELKTNKYGFRFRPSIMKMLKSLSDNRNKPMSELVELFIINESRKEGLV